MPIGDTGAAQFIAAHPTWDGRGSTIGIVDTGVDLDHPALPTTTHRRAQDHRLGHLHRPVHRRRPDLGQHGRPGQRRARFTFRRRDATPRRPPARYRIGLFNERDPRLGGEVGSDVNRDGNPAGSSGIFAVLWNTATNTVWVDTNQNDSFADEPAMTDYKVDYDVGYFGTDNPATAVARADAVRRPDRRQEQGRQHRHRLRRRTARTSPASPPATACSAAR